MLAHTVFSFLEPWLSLPFLLPLRTHSPGTPAPGHLWERNAQIPLRFHHWNTFSGAANRKFLYFCFVLGAKLASTLECVCVQKETQE